MIQTVFKNVTDHMRSQFSEWKISINDNVLRFTLDESIKEEQASLAMQQANPKYHAPAY
ncbi:hypothetical protein O9929_24505 [Vibrio lentus]|nr:hypothetical protein [Vibrio lentus]